MLTKRRSPLQLWGARVLRGVADPLALFSGAFLALVFGAALLTEAGVLAAFVSFLTAGLALGVAMAVVLSNQRARRDPCVPARIPTPRVEVDLPNRIVERTLMDLEQLERREERLSSGFTVSQGDTRREERWTSSSGRI